MDVKFVGKGGDLPFLPITTVGEFLIGRCKKTLDVMLVIQTPIGPITQPMSDDIGLQLGIEIIREIGRRSIRTEAMLKNLNAALQAATSKEKTDGVEASKTEVVVESGCGNGAGADHGGNGSGGPGLGREPRSDLSPCSPRSLGLTSEPTGGRGHSSK